MWRTDMLSRGLNQRGTTIEQVIEHQEECGAESTSLYGRNLVDILSLPFFCLLPPLVRLALKTMLQSCIIKRTERESKHSAQAFDAVLGCGTIVSGNDGSGTYCSLHMYSV